MKSYKFRIAILIFFILILSGLTTYLISKGYHFSVFFSIAAILFLAIKLYRQIEKAIEVMERMIISIQYTDFNISFARSVQEREFKHLGQMMDDAIRSFRDKLYQLEIDHQYYNTLLSTIDSGLLVINKRGEIEWINQAALKELEKSNINNIAELKNLHPELPKVLSELKAGDVKIVNISKQDFKYELIITGISFFVQGKELLLISLKNIQTVLEETEIEAWQKLIRVLTHEIMNTIAPIISLSETVTERASENGNSEKEFALMLQVMQTIHRRSKGLLDFVENYRKLTRIPTPTFAKVWIKPLFDDIQKLMQNTTQAQISFDIESPGLYIIADRSMIEQVLINLIKNAYEAQYKQPIAIQVKASQSKGMTSISVTDNGTGIVAEALDKIFIPFYTTKANGSGIGLSLCRQIMNMHGGSISAKSREGEGSQFTLRFKNRETQTHSFS